ncbi:hypothetical protein [Fodinicola acaciae]|uniref:hypothetical protein n=1 Tax=Fodinicola acaciae TaxID=2681555 RepID=UPI0013CF4D89|nr:hypothetical protein [Fodinicola acaciae]
MTAPVTEIREADADFDLVIGDLETEIPALDDITASTTHVGTVSGCRYCTCISYYCW